jgi:hypothetical protein
MNNKWKRLTIAFSVTILILTALSLTACNGAGAGGGNTDGGDEGNIGGNTNGGGDTHTHQWGEWYLTTHATCTTKGVETRTCALDTEHKETRDIAIDPDAHHWEQLEGTAATCTAEGNGKRKCTF